MSPEETEDTSAPLHGPVSPEESSLPRKDLLTIWKVMERLVVSADRIAGAHEFRLEEGAAIDEDVRQEHNQSLADYLEDITPDLMEVRNLLLEHLDLAADEADHLTRNVIQYWVPSRASIDYEGEDLGKPDISLK